MVHEYEAVFRIGRLGWTKDSECPGSLLLTSGVG